MSASAPRMNRKRPSSTIVIATVPMAVTCIPVLREKLRDTSPRKNFTLPESKIVAPLFVVDDAAVVETHDAAAHTIDDGLIVGRNDDRRSLEIDALQERGDFGGVRR